MSYLNKIFECAGLVVMNLSGKPLNNNLNGRRDWVALGDYLAAAVQSRRSFAIIVLCALSSLYLVKVVKHVKHFCL